MPSLTHYLTPNHIQQAHGKIIVTVENEDDVPFWKAVFEEAGLATRIFPGISTKKRSERGKTTVLTKKDVANKNYILCVDSDYDYLTQNDVDTIHSNPFIFQTYTYSYENYLCLPQTLNTVVSEACLVDASDFDFISFFEAYSEIIYELFLCHLYDKIKYKSQNFSITDLHFVIDFPQHPNIKNNGRAILDKIAQNVAQKITAFKTDYEISNEAINILKLQMLELGLDAKNVYLFLRGHNVFDNTVGLVKQIVYPIIEKYKQQLHQRDDTKRKEYIKHIKSVELVLMLNKKHEKSELFAKILADIHKYKEQ